MKIVVAGPPHSGKSVFLGALTSLLNKEDYFLFRACPDGEGSWTYRSEESVKYRRKGTFTEEIVDWYISSLANSALAPLVLVDIGGRITEENRRILSEGKIDMAIILSGTHDGLSTWKEFLESCNVGIFAEILSAYDLLHDREDSCPMVVHHLERGEDCSSRPVIQKIASQLTDLAEKIRFPKQEVFQISQLAKLIGKKEEEKTLPNGKVVTSISWNGDDLPIVSRFLHNRSGEFNSPVKINGAAPGWLVTAITHELHPAQVELNSPDGYVLVGCNKPGIPSGDNLQWKTEVIEEGWKDKWTLITCEQIDPSIPISPDDLQGITPPMIEMGEKVILSGRLPNWLLASLAMSYHGIAKAIACFQPGVGATVSITHSKEVQLGKVVSI